MRRSTVAHVDGRRLARVALAVEEQGVRVVPHGASWAEHAGRRELCAACRLGRGLRLGTLLAAARAPADAWGQRPAVEQGLHRAVAAAHRRVARRVAVIVGGGARPRPPPAAPTRPPHARVGCGGMQGVPPPWFCFETSIPSRASSHSTAAKQPFAAAQCSAVLPRSDSAVFSDRLRSSHGSAASSLSSCSTSPRFAAPIHAATDSLYAICSAVLGGLRMVEVLTAGAGSGERSGGLCGRSARRGAAAILCRGRLLLLVEGAALDERLERLVAELHLYLLDLRLRALVGRLEVERTLVRGEGLFELLSPVPRGPTREYAFAHFGRSETARSPSSSARSNISSAA